MGFCGLHDARVHNIDRNIEQILIVAARTICPCDSQVIELK